MALSGHSNRTAVCPLLDQSGQSLILARDGLSAFNPKRTFKIPAQRTSEIIRVARGIAGELWPN
jgi:hypothetical protein